MSNDTKKLLSIILPAALIVWGIVTLILFIGAPYHANVVLESANWSKLVSICGTRGGDAAFSLPGMLCQGTRGFIPFFADAIAKMSPLLWYAVWSLVIFIGFACYKLAKHSSRGIISVRIRPWQWLLLFTASCWLILLFLSGNQVTNLTKANELPEALRSAYREDMSEDSFKAIEADFKNLKERNCLTEAMVRNPQTGELQSKILQMSDGTNVQIYRYKTLCLHGSFLRIVVPHILFSVFIIFELLVLGRFLLSFLRIPLKSRLTEALLSIALGACGLILTLWLLAVVGLFMKVVGWLILIAVPIALFKHSAYWLRQCHEWTMEFEWKWHNLVPVLAWLLLSYIALNYLSVVRPFPIGWDDLGTYLNRPKLLVSYGEFIYLLPMLKWEYLTSLGFLLFGYESTIGSTASMLINWLAGLFALGSIGVFTHRFFGGRGGLLSTTFYYLLPMVGHFSFADMKIDNAVFFMGTMAAFCVFAAFLFREKDEQSFSSLSKEQIGWLILAGIFSGFAFSFKPTAIMLILTLTALILGLRLHWSGFLVGMLFATTAYTIKGVLNIGRIAGRIFGTTGDFLISNKHWAMLFGALGIIGLLLLLQRYRNRAQQALYSCGLYLVPVVVAIAIPVLHNNVQAKNIIPKLLLSAPNTITPILDVNGQYSEPEDEFGRPIRSLPPQLQVNKEHPACINTGRIEELDRYWGDYQGIGHYLTLPWRALLNRDIRGYYVTLMHAFFFFPLILLLPAFWKKKDDEETNLPRRLQWLCIITVALIIQWVLLGNGVIWYGISMFLGLIVCLEALYLLAPNRTTRIALGVFFAFSIVIMLSMRFWQLELQRSNLEYTMGKASSEVLEERTVPFYRKVAEQILQLHKQNPQRPYLYRIGTFTPYFIPKNLEVIGLQDHQLGFFNCLNQEAYDVHTEYRSKIEAIETQLESASAARFTEEQIASLRQQKSTLETQYLEALAPGQKLTADRLKVLGFHSIIYDVNTHTIEKSPGTLHAKVRNFIDFINHPASNIQYVINRPKDAKFAYFLIR